MSQVLSGLRLSASGVKILYGSGDPNSSASHDVQVAAQGSLFLRQDGGTSTTLYVCTGTQTVVSFGVVALWTAK